MDRSPSLCSVPRQAAMQAGNLLTVVVIAALSHALPLPAGSAADVGDLAGLSVRTRSPRCRRMLPAPLPVSWQVCVSVCGTTHLRGRGRRTRVHSAAMCWRQSKVRAGRCWRVFKEGRARPASVECTVAPRDSGSDIRCADRVLRFAGAAARSGGRHRCRPHAAPTLSCRAMSRVPIGSFALNDWRQRHR